MRILRFIMGVLCGVGGSVSCFGLWAHNTEQAIAGGIFFVIGMGFGLLAIMEEN